MLIILDRDGVINEESSTYIKSPAEWLPIPGSLEAIAKLKHAGFQVVVATNQSGIARGLYDEGILAQIHALMARELQQRGAELDGIFYCPHHPSDGCACRKPEAGLLLRISTYMDADLTAAILIGDSHTDLQAAEKVGAQFMLVLTGNGQKTLTQLGHQSIPTYKDLAHAVDVIINRQKETH